MKLYEFVDTKKDKEKEKDECDDKESLPSVKTLTPEELADKHDVPLKDIKKQLKAGIEVEKEHTKSTKLAREIALDHIKEDPKYYIPHLRDMEKKFQKD